MVFAVKASAEIIEPNGGRFLLPPQPGCNSAGVEPAKRGDFVFEVQIGFISITKDGGLPNVPDFNEALTVVFASISSVYWCAGAAVGPRQPHKLLSVPQESTSLGFNGGRRHVTTS